MSKKICKPSSPLPPKSSQTAKTTDLYSQLRILTHFSSALGKNMQSCKTRWQLVPLTLRPHRFGHLYTVKEPVCFCINMWSADLSSVWTVYMRRRYWYTFTLLCCTACNVLRLQAFSDPNVFAVSSDSCNNLQSHANAGSRPAFTQPAYGRVEQHVSSESLICATPPLTLVPS